MSPGPRTLKWTGWIWLALVPTIRLFVNFFDWKRLRGPIPTTRWNGLLFMKRHYEGGYILRELILVEAFPDKAALGGWRIKYGYQENNPGKPGVDTSTRELKGEAGIAFDIPIAQKTRPGVRGTLRIEARSWA